MHSKASVFLTILATVFVQDSQQAVARLAWSSRKSLQWLWVIIRWQLWLLGDKKREEIFARLIDPSTASQAHLDEISLSVVT